MHLADDDVRFQRDTTAQALSWTFFHLLTNPELITPLRQEADDNPTVDYDSYRSMTDTLATFHEGLRLHPSVPKVRLPSSSISPAFLTDDHVPLRTHGRHSQTTRSPTDPSSRRETSSAGVTGNSDA